MNDIWLQCDELFIKCETNDVYLIWSGNDVLQIRFERITVEFYVDNYDCFILSAQTYYLSEVSYKEFTAMKLFRNYSIV